MEYFKDYIAPELLILVPVLYLIGMALKSIKKVPDNYIPAILGVVGIVLAGVYLLSQMGMTPDVVFAAITQGVLCTGCSVYVNQLIKQGGKS